VVAAIAAALFAVLAVLATVSWTALRHADAAASSAGHSLLVHDTGARTATIVVTTLGSPPVVDAVAVLAVLVLAWQRDWGWALGVAFARLGESGVETLVKVIVGRPRPPLLPHLVATPGASFPSGHAAGTAATYVAVALAFTMSSSVALRRWAIAAAAVLIVAVAASRVLLGVHYPTDVLGGAALGIAFAVAGNSIAVYWNGARSSPA
jgi:undecaprenyl-diphosphatase